MADSKGEADFLQPPDDIATLYTWANLYGAKYRDFSASRQQRRLRNREEVQAGYGSEGANKSASQAERVKALVEGTGDSERISSKEALLETGTSSSPASNTVRPDSTPLAVTFMEEEVREPIRTSWSCVNETVPSEQHTKARVPDKVKEEEDVTDPSCDPREPRWHALKSILGHSGGMPDLFRKHDRDGVAPIVAVFSLSGGVGKTSLLAALGREFSAAGEKVLLIDTAPYGLLPFYFGARDQRPGIVRTFAPAESRDDAAVRVISLGTEELSPSDVSGKEIAQKLKGYATDATRILIDLATASKSVTNNVLKLSPIVIIPVVPDMSSVMTLGAIEFFFRRYQTVNGEQVKRYYLLNQYDESLQLHVDIRNTLYQQLGDRLLPLPFRHDEAVSEALAEGITVVDYAPDSAAALDVKSLSNWLRQVSPSAALTGRGAHWSEQ